MVCLITDKQPLLHLNCRCSTPVIKTIKSGTPTINGIDSANYVLKSKGKLPDYYVSFKKAKKLGYRTFWGNLNSIGSNCVLAKVIYQNPNGHLPSIKGQVWYEDDINYKLLYRNSQRVLYSNDGLILVTYDHCLTFFKIIYQVKYELK